MTEVYDGPAEMRVAEMDHAVRVRLTGHLDPIDGHYHWRGMVFELRADNGMRMPQPVTVTIGHRTAEAHLTEMTPWGTHCVAGIGAPPYPLDPDDIEVVTTGD
jgi:Domain of unknown function (DUF4873)